jgi:hypothetical protein
VIGERTSAVGGVAALLLMSTACGSTDNGTSPDASVDADGGEPGRDSGPGPGRDGGPGPGRDSGPGPADAGRLDGGAPVGIFFEEGFEDADLASRGWYDGPRPTIVDDPVRGRVLELRFLAGATSALGIPGRHCLQAGPTPCVGSSRSVYLSYWVRYSDNWVGSQLSSHPHEFFFLTHADPDFVGPAGAQLEVLVEQTHCLRDRLGRNDCPGSDTGMLPRLVVSSATSMVTGRIDADAVFFSDAAGPRYKGDWHHVEAYFEMGSAPGVADGVAAYWHDGTVVIDRADVLFWASGSTPAEFSHMLIGPYINGRGAGSPVEQTMWIDDLVVAASPPG